MLKIIFAFIFVSSWAQETDVPAAIDRLNQKVKTMRGPELCTTCGFPAGMEAPPNAWKTCLKEICGNNLGAENKELEKILKAPASENPAFKEIGPLVRKAFRTEIEAQAQAARVLMDWIKSGKSFDDPAAKRLLWLTKVLKTQTHLKYNDRGELDRDKSYDSLLSAGLSSNEAELALETGAGVERRQKQLPPALQSDFDYAKQSLAIEEIERQLRGTLKQWENLIAKNSELISAPPSIFGASGDSVRDLEKKLNEGRFDRNDAWDLSQKLSLAQTLNHFLTDAKIGERTATAPPFIPPSAADLSKDLREMEDFLTGKPAPAVPKLNLALQLEITMSQCYSMVAIGSAKLPDANDVQRLVKKDEPDLRKKFIKKLRGFLSSSSSALVEGEFKASLLRPPDTREAFLKRMSEDLKELSTRDALATESLKKSLSLQSQQRISALLITATGQSSAAELNSLCSRSFPDVYDNHAIPDRRGKFHLSASAITAGADSEFVTNHEYSHLASGFLSKDQRMSRASREWYDAVRNCLAQGHSERGEDRVEEDFADLLGASFTGGGKHFCRYIPEDESSVTLHNWNPDDRDHSGHFYRVLHHRVITGAGIPESCRTALAEKGEAPFERNCLKETPEAAHR